MDQVIVSRRIVSALYAVIDAVKTYPYHVHATLPTKKLDAVVNKFKERYPDLSRDRKYAWRQRKAGLSTHKLIVFKPDTEKDINGFFVLMASSKDDSGENWLDARERKERIVVYGYELVRHTRKGNNKPAWTWRISSERYKKHVEQLVDAIAKKKDVWIVKWIASTLTWPGFAGVRAQHKALKKIFYGKWNRLRKNMPPTWPRLPYVTRKATSKNRCGLRARTP